MAMMVRFTEDRDMFTVPLFLTGRLARRLLLNLFTKRAKRGNLPFFSFVDAPNGPRCTKVRRNVPSDTLAAARVSSDQAPISQ
jgi:hypothetical protein